MPTRQIRVPPLQLSGGAGGLAESVARQITNSIQLGLVAPGERLPSEGVLAGHLGVSPMTLREALAALREQGLVETRRGRSGGSFICAPGSPSASSLKRRLRALSATEIRDVGDEQFAVGGTSAYLAARRARTVDVERLRELTGQLASASSIGGRARSTGQFWIEVSLASQSERLTQAALRIQSSIGELVWVPMKGDIDERTMSERLNLIVDAIESEDDQSARSRAESVIDLTTRHLIAAHLDLTRRQPDPSRQT